MRKANNEERDPRSDGPGQLTLGEHLKLIAGLIGVFTIIFSVDNTQLPAIVFGLGLIIFPYEVFDE